MRKWSAADSGPRSPGAPFLHMGARRCRASRRLPCVSPGGVSGSRLSRLASPQTFGYRTYQRHEPDMSQEMPVVIVDNAPLNAQIMIDTLKKCGATHLVWLPDTE